MDVRAVMTLVISLLGDPRVSRAAKGAVVAAGATLLGAGLLPAPLARAARMARVPAALAAVRHLIAAAGHDVVSDHWRGSPDGLGVVLVVTGVES
jgi:hypothetical protein